MPFGRPQSSASAARGVSARAFSFVEILFAIGVLGIGFIMLAALFPVGLQQTKLTIDETAAAAAARGAVANLEQLEQTLVQYVGAVPPVTEQNGTYPICTTFVGTLPTAAQLAAGQSMTMPGQVRSFRDGRRFVDVAAANNDARRDAVWSEVSGSLLSSSNDRNACALLFKRDVIARNVAGTIVAKPADSAQIIVINAQVAAASAYVSGTNVVGGVNGDVIAPAATVPFIYNLEPRPIGVTIQFNNTAGAYVVSFSSAKGPNPNPTVTQFRNNIEYDAVADTGRGAVGEGAFIVISDDQITAPRTDIGRMNGRIYRVGIQRTDLGTNLWELSPGYGFTPDPGASGKFHDVNAADSNAKDDIVSIGLGGTGTDNATYQGSSVITAGPAIAYVLGRGFDNLSATPVTGISASHYAGPVQDVTIYTTFIPAK